MYRAIDRCPKPVIARVQGAALGGGCGLIAAVSDIVVAASDAVFGFTEVKLGIIPAVISPFVLPKIGVSHARALFVTGERFDAAQRAAHRARAPRRCADELDARIDAHPRRVAHGGAERDVAAAKRSCATSSSADRTTKHGAHRARDRQAARQRGRSRRLARVSRTAAAAAGAIGDPAAARRQSRRDRDPHRARRARAGHRRRSASTPMPTRAHFAPGSWTRVRASVRRPAARIVPRTSRRSSPPRARSAPTRCTRATAFSPNARRSRKRCSTPG